MNVPEKLSASQHADDGLGELAEQMQTLFKGASTHYGRYNNDLVADPVDGEKVEIKSARVETVKATPNLTCYVDHISGRSPLGISPLQGDDHCVWGAIDIDDYNVSVNDVFALIKRHRLPLVPCRSKSGGLHLYLFAAEAIPAPAIRQALQGMAFLIGYEGAEIFPKQEVNEGGRYSSWLNLPYFDGDSTNRYAFKASGLGMALSEFLGFAADNKVRAGDIERFARQGRDASVAPASATVVTGVGAEGKLQEYAAELTAAPPRSANSTLSKAAFGMGRYVRDGAISEAEVEGALFEAWLARGKDEREFKAVFPRQLKKGVEKGYQISSSSGPETSIVVCLGDVEPKPIRWLWRGRFACGKMSLLAGHPGVGKSQLSMWMAARVTDGGEWPFGEGRAPLGSVLILSAEDDVADTMRPRCDAAGGVATSIKALKAIRKTDGKERGFDLGADLHMIEQELDKMPDAQLVIIDPISAYVGKIDSNRNSDVRGILAPVQQLAERRGVAIICVSHLVKASGRAAIGSVSGSGAFMAAARTACIVTKELEPVKDEDGKVKMVETGCRLMTVAKNNIGPDGADQGLAYRIEVKTLPNGLKAPVVVWDRVKHITADEALNPYEYGDNSEKKISPIDKAVEFLEMILKDGEVLQSVIDSKAKEEGIMIATLNNAKAKLKVRSRKQHGQGGRWAWSLPGVQSDIPF